jgi:AcrR family transcriptional regulator
MEWSAESARQRPLHRSKVDLLASVFTHVEATASVCLQMSGTSTTPPPAGRRYGGRTAEERRAERREQLVEAGYELFGTVGFPNTSIRAVLRESGLAERYFYESFDSLEGLLVAVHEDVHAAVVAAVRKATEAAGADVDARARAGLYAFVETIMSDPRWVRIKLAELSGAGASDGLREFRRRAHLTFASLLVDYGPTEQVKAKGLNPQALALAVVAAIESLLDAWAAGELRLTLDELVEHAVVVIRGTSVELERQV